MDLNFSQDSFAFSDAAPPSHVSDLESFSDFDLSDASETSFVEFAPRTTTEVRENGGASNENCNGADILEKKEKSSANEKFSLGLQELNANNIQDFLAAIQSAQTQGVMASSARSGTSLLSGDESSLGLLQLDALSNLSDNLQNLSLLEKDLTMPLDRTLVGDDKQTQPAVNQHDPVDAVNGEDIPFSSGYDDASNMTPVVNRNTAREPLEEQRPDTGQDPDTFFSPQNGEVSHDINVHDITDEDPMHLSYGQEELNVMLQGRSGSGDGGELIDRVSLTSSISFIQSQTFPESIFSQSFSSTSRGLGSGMDSRSGSDDDEDEDDNDDNRDNTLPLLHGAGDGSNGSIGRPGLEGANSDVEDVPAHSAPPLDTSSRQETQGLGLRQSAEGVDVIPYVLGDGGGGGDGSSGNNSDDDDGGPAGAAYATSSSSVLPSTTTSTTAYQLSSGSIQYSSSLPGASVLSVGRGCPVGDAAVDGSPVLLPSPPEHLNEAGGLISTPLPLHLQATSTPLVRQNGLNDNTLAHDVNNETSVLESCYLMGQNPPSDTVLGRRSVNTVAEAESLNFDVHVGEFTTGYSFAQDRETTLTALGIEPRNIQATKEESRRGEKSRRSMSSSSLDSDLSVKLGKSALFDASSIGNDSQLWKSTPRDEEEAAVRATPGIVFQGHQRPSTVTGHAYFGDPQTPLPSNSQNVTELALERTLTPGMAADEVATPIAPDWTINQPTTSPWPPGEFGTRDSVPGRNPFDSEGPIEPPSWTLGRDATLGRNPFEDDGFDGFGNSFALGSDLDFEPQGDAAAIIAADEENFNREHQFEIMSQTQPQEITKMHDWTIPEGQFVTRPSLLRVMGINDPNDAGEVRVSFGRFLAAGSEELGSLSRTSPDRPRPQFGNDKPILTPPQQGSNVADVSVTKSSVDKSLKQDKQEQGRNSDTTVQRMPGLEAVGRQGGHREDARKLSDSSASHLQDNRSWETKKLQLDEQYKREGKVKIRSRTASQTSSHSSSSRSSVKSVIKTNKDKQEQTVQSKRSAGGESRAKPGNRKRSDRKDRRETHNAERPSGESQRSENVGSQQENLLISNGVLLSSMKQGLFGESNATSLESLSQFIADAINADPDNIRKLLAANANAKANAKSKKKQHVSSVDGDVEEKSKPESQSFNPLASSSPQSASSPEKMVYAHSSIERTELEMPSDTAMEDSVFPAEDSLSRLPMSLKELDSKGSSLKRDSAYPSERGLFRHVIPQFGETYTLRNAQNRANQEQDVPSVDPLGHRGHEIEQRLNRSLPRNDASLTSNTALSDSMLTKGKPYPSSARDTSAKPYITPLGRNQRLDTSVDSAVESMSSSVSRSTSVNRHSWPEAPSSHQHNQIDFAHNGGPRQVATSGSQQTEYTALVERVTDPSSHRDRYNSSQVSAPVVHGHEIENLRVAAQPNNMYEHQTPIHSSLLVQGAAGIPITMGPALTGHTMPTMSGFHGHNGPAIAPLSHTASAAFGPRVVPFGSIVHPAQGFGTMNPLQNHVPFVQTVSATLAPKPSSLTPTYVQSFSTDIPYNINSQQLPQLPLHLQTGASNIAVIPTSMSQPTVHTSIPYMQTSLPQVNNGLLQVRPDLSQGAALLSSTPVILPGEIKFPPVCCVGVLTQTVIPLHNSSSRWMHCEIHSIVSTVNGVQVPSSAGAFAVQPKAIIAPHTTENVKISVEPRETGTFTTQLQIYSFPVVCEVQPVTHSLGPVLALEVVAEEPRVEVLLEETNAVDFGEVVSGALQCKPLRLVNRCRADVPVRIIISANSTTLPCFAFAEADFSPKTDVLLGPSPAMPKTAALTIHTLTLRGQTDVNSQVEPTAVWLLFQSPKTKLTGASSVGQPDEFIARLDVEIDSAQQGPTISSVLLKALSGVVKLHTPHRLQVVNLSTSVGKRTSRTIPVKNAGNITAKVNLKVEGDLQQFSVRPVQLLLRPEQESEVQIAYQPTGPDSHVESTLVLTVPDGPVYEVTIQGSIVAEEDDSSILLSSKPVLCWGGVAIGSSQQQKVVLKTSSTSPVKKLQLHIEGNHSDFQIQPTFRSHSNNPESPIVTLGPQKELPVHVVFSPSSMGLISSALIIKSLSGRTKSKIPLHGCGGTSQLVLVDIRQLSEGYVTNIGEVSLGKKNVVKVTIRNSGSRAAFVKAVCYSDIHSLQLYPSSHLNVLPNNFVLSERTSKQVLIEYQPTERDAVNCRNAVNSVAVIAFYTGDEFLRRQYKNHLRRHPQQQPLETRENSLLAGINFTSSFQDEDRQIEDVRYPQVPSWDNFFQGCVSRVLLTLVGSPPASNTERRPADPNSSVDVVPMSDNPAGSATVNRPTRSIPNGNTETDSWAVIPERLILSPPLSNSDKAGSERLEIINFSERPLGFEFSWPAHLIVITPETGEIPPRSQTRVLVSAKSNPPESRIQLPWGGDIHVKCDGAQKAIKVQIREELAPDGSPYQPGLSTFQSVPAAAAGNTPLPADHLPPLKIKHKDIGFVKTQIGKVSMSEIVVSNTTSTELRWDLSSLAPAYVKVDEAGSIFRSTYPAFRVGRHSGSIETGKTIQIAVKFQPRNVGQYSQSWDLTLPNASKVHGHFKQRIILHGQAVDRTVDSGGPNDGANEVHSTAVTKKVTIAGPPARPPSNDKKGVYLAEHVIQFPVTSAGQSSVAKVKICNDSEDSYLVRAASPPIPFSVQHMKFSVRPHRFVRVPVKFSPTEPGQSFHKTLVFTSHSDIILTVRLQATSAK